MSEPLREDPRSPRFERVDGVYRVTALRHAEPIAFSVRGSSCDTMTVAGARALARLLEEAAAFAELHELGVAPSPRKR